MLNRRVSSVERSTANGNGSSGEYSSPHSGTVYSSQFMYHRSISTPSPSSLPKAIPFNRGYRSRSVFAQNVNWDGSIPPCSAPVTFNRYINVNCNNNNNASDSSAGSPTTSWYARLSSSLKKSVLRRTTSNRESAQKRNVRGGLQRRSVISVLFSGVYL